MRPTQLRVGDVLKWEINTRNPDTQLLKDADSTPTITIRKNGSSTSDSATVTKRSATTGIYDVEYNPAGEVEGDVFSIRESVTMTGTTTAQATYQFSWPFPIVAPMRGTDGANTVAPDNAGIAAGAASAATAATQASGANTKAADIQSRLPAALDGGRMVAKSEVVTGTVALATSQPNYAPAKAGDAMTLTPGERTAVANEVEAQIVDDTDSERVLQAIVDKIAAANPSLDDLTLGGIASAVRSELATELARIDAAITSRASQSSVDVIDDFVDTEITTLLNRQVPLNSTQTQAAAAAAITAAGLATSGDVDSAEAAILDAIDAIEGGGGGGGTNGTGQHKITVTVQRSTDAQKINNVRVDIVGTTTHDFTNTNGIAELNVGPNATYTLRITTPAGFESYADFTQPVVTSDVTKLVELEPSPVGATPIAGTCEIIDFVLDSGLQPVEGALVRATASKDAVLSDAGILSQLVAKATTDSTGRFVLRLARADAMEAGKEYTIEIKHQTKSIYRQVVGEVPNQEVALLKEIQPAE